MLVPLAGRVVLIGAQRNVVIDRFFLGQIQKDKEKDTHNKKESQIKRFRSARRLPNHTCGEAPLLSFVVWCLRAKCYGVIYYTIFPPAIRHRCMELMSGGSMARRQVRGGDGAATHGRRRASAHKGRGDSCNRAEQVAWAGGSRAPTQDLTIFLQPFLQTYNESLRSPPRFTVLLTVVETRADHDSASILHTLLTTNQQIKKYDQKQQQKLPHQVVLTKRGAKQSKEAKRNNQAEKRKRTIPRARADQH